MKELIGDGSASGVVLTQGRTRVWVERGVLHWKRGRRTVIIPGVQIRRVEVSVKSLTVVLSEDAQVGGAMSLRHHNEVMVAALGAEIEAIISDTGSSGVRQPVQQQLVRVWPLRVLANLRDRIRNGHPLWRVALWYVVLGLPLAVGLPVDRALGLLAWLLTPLSALLLYVWIGMSELNTRWVIWRRGITVRARYTSEYDSGQGTIHTVHFRTIDGREVSTRAADKGCRDEIAYDPEDPSRVIAPTRVAWLGTALAWFVFSGFWGILLGLPAVRWMREVLLLPF